MRRTFDYIRAKSWYEAAGMLDSYGNRAAVLAGGTDLVPALKLRLRKPEVLIDLKGIQGAEAIGQFAADHSRITVLGPLMTLSRVSGNSFIRETYPALALAASKVGSPQLRHMGTLGGNICLNTRCIYYNQSEQWRKARAPCLKMVGKLCHVQKRGKICLAEFKADTVPVLIALNAELKIISTKGERVIPLSDFYSGTGNPPNLLGPSELIKEIRLPQPPEGSVAAYEKFTAREEIDFPSVSLAIVLNIDRENQKCRQAKIVVGGALPSPFVCRKASAILHGHNPDAELIQLAAREAAHEARPVNPTGFSVSYKRHLIEILAARGLHGLLNSV